ncbi:hypothetical protein L218DRAFT_1008988 [Marasmius fiardii PR-910]|nr:hypothetical protein L218DRAFT_1008988 [Marasmius fiardii PR-910]
MSRIFYLALFAVSMAILVSAMPEPEKRDVEERQLDSILSQATGGVVSVFSQATGGAASVFSDATSLGAGVFTTVVSAAQGAATVVTSAGGQAITIVTSGAGRATSFAGAEYSAVVTSFAGSEYTALVRQNSAKASFDSVPMAAAFITMVFGAVVGALLTL